MYCFFLKIKNKTLFSALTKTVVPMITCSFRSTTDNVLQIEISGTQWTGETEVICECWASVSTRIHRKCLAGRFETEIMSQGTLDSSGFRKPFMSFTKFISGVSTLEARKSIDGAPLSDNDLVFDGDNLILFRKPIDEPTRRLYHNCYQDALARLNPPSDASVETLRRQIDARMPPLPDPAICPPWHHGVRHFCLEEATYYLSRLPAPLTRRRLPGPDPCPVEPQLSPSGMPKKFLRRDASISL